MQISDNAITLQNTIVFDIRKGDITAIEVDAIVNAANANLVHGGGVAAAIRSRGGESIQQESDQWLKDHGCIHHKTPAITSAGNLPAKYVFHALGPIWGEGNEPQKLCWAIEGCLKQAVKMNLRSIAFPAISTGIYQFPKKLAAEIFMDTIIGFCHAKKTAQLNQITIVLFDAKSLEIFKQALNQAWSNIS